MDDLLPLFLAEARESMALLADDLVLLGRCPADGAARNRARRALHTLKGSCGFVGLDAIATLAHRGEDLLNGADDLVALADTIAAIAQALDELDAGAVAAAPTPWTGLSALGADLARKLGRDFDLVVDDHGIVPDFVASRALRRALPHLIRNAAGHGLEAAAERRRAGKAARGHISVAATLANGRLTVTVCDDGRGFDIDGLGRAAAAAGVVAPAPLARMDAAKAASLALAAGVTTAATVTPLAGRGVGLDAVRHEIEAVGGEVAIDTTPGRGTTIVLTLPQPAPAAARAA